MNIIFDSPQIDTLKNRHVVLELDTFVLPNLSNPIKSYCVVNQIPVTEINTLESYVKLHNDLLEHYRKKDWKVCEDAIGLLIGRWGNELDSFYQLLFERIQNLKTQQLPESWQGFVDKS
jgi:hypothetical protein